MFDISAKLRTARNAEAGTEEDGGMQPSVGIASTRIVGDEKGDVEEGNGEAPIKSSDDGTDEENAMEVIIDGGATDDIDGTAAPPVTDTDELANMSWIKKKQQHDSRFFYIILSVFVLAGVIGAIVASVVTRNR